MKLHGQLRFVLILWAATLVVGVLPRLHSGGSWAAAASGADTELDAAVTKVLAGHFKQNGPGAAVLIANNSKVILKKYYGLADVDRRQPINQASVFDLASVSKQFTAAALLLIGEGKLGLHDPVRRVLPDYRVPVKGRAVTVADLIYHISGLADYTDDDWDGTTEQFRHLTAEGHLKWLNGTTPRRAPGVKYEYNNSEYALLALIVERTSGMSFAQFVRTRLFKPAGMTGSFVHDRLDLHLQIPGLVTGYNSESGKIVKSSEWTQITGDGNVLATLDDMARWDRALRQDTILTAQQKKLAWVSGRLDNGRPINEDGYGYGFGWSTDASDDSVFHSGSWMGTSTYIVRYLTTGLTIVVLSNDEHADANGIANEVEAVLPQ